LFKVKDQGRGIPADKIESIFERFDQVYASDSRKKGTGLAWLYAVALSSSTAGGFGLKVL
jgi:K+-sensing histidine kinase KdpD